MNWLLIGLLTAITASSQTPLENAQRLNEQGNRAGESGNDREAIRLYQESVAIWRSMGPEYEATHGGDAAESGGVVKRRRPAPGGVQGS